MTGKVLSKEDVAGWKLARLQNVNTRHWDEDVTMADSHEALRDLLRRVVNHRFYGGDIVFHYLEPGLRAEVDAALGVGG